MPGEFRIFSERGLVYLNFFEDTRIAQCLETLAALVADPDWSADYALLVDNSHVTSYDGDFSQMQRFCGQLEDINAFTSRTIRVAYYAPSDLGFGVARMTQQVLSARLPLDIHVFREEAQALAALGQKETRLSDLFAATA